MSSPVDTIMSGPEPTTPSTPPAPVLGLTERANRAIAEAEKLFFDFYAPDVKLPCLVKYRPYGEDGEAHIGALYSLRNIAMVSSSSI